MRLGPEIHPAVAGVLRPASVVLVIGIHDAYFGVALIHCARFMGTMGTSRYR